MIAENILPAKWGLHLIRLLIGHFPVDPGEQLKLRIVRFFRYFNRKDNFIAHRLVGKIAGRTV